MKPTAAFSQVSQDVFQGRAGPALPLSAALEKGCLQLVLLPSRTPGGLHILPELDLRVSQQDAHPESEQPIQRDLGVWLGVGVVAPENFELMLPSAWAAIQGIVQATPDPSVPDAVQPLQGLVPAGSAATAAEAAASFDVARLYQAIKPLGTEPLLAAQPDALLPTLRKFQVRR